jgi:hypothetical protein
MHFLCLQLRLSVTPGICRWILLSKRGKDATGWNFTMQMHLPLCHLYFSGVEVSVLQQQISLRQPWNPTALMFGAKTIFWSLLPWPSLARLMVTWGDTVLGDGIIQRKKWISKCCFTTRLRLDINHLLYLWWSCPLFCLQLQSLSPVWEPLTRLLSITLRKSFLPLLTKHRSHLYKQLTGSMLVYRKSLYHFKKFLKSVDILINYRVEQMKE